MTFASLSSSGGSDVVPRLLFSAAVAMALVVGAADSTPAGSRPQTVAPGETTLSVVGTNDLHGAVLPTEGRGGLALLAGYLNNLRRLRDRDGGSMLIIDAGDMWQGTMESNLTEGQVVIEAYNAMEYAAAAIGNHEFDFGPVGPAMTPQRDSDDPRGALKARALEARFPFLAANIIDSATGRPVAWPNARPSVLLDRGGITVGVTGVTTRASLNATIAANTRGLTLAPLATSIEAEATRLRSQGATIIVVAAHAGGSCRDLHDPANLASCDQEGEIFDVARSLPPGLVDVIVGGHTHAAIAHRVNGVSVMEAYSRGRSFSRLDLVIDRTTGRILDRRSFVPEEVCAFADSRTGRCASANRTGPKTATTYAGATVEPDRTVEAILRSAAARVEALKRAPLGIVAATTIPIDGEAESPLGNLFTDALLAAVRHADVAVNNTGGGLRAILPAGPVTYGRLFEVFPFDNKLAELLLTGAGLRRVFAGELQRSDRVLGISGLRVLARCDGARLAVTMLRPSGGEVSDDERLVVATTDFLATGVLFRPVAPAGGFTTAADAPMVRDLVAEQLTRRAGVVRAADLVDRIRPRWPPPSSLPFRCNPRRQPGE